MVLLVKVGEILPEDSWDLIRIQKCQRLHESCGLNGETGKGYRQDIAYLGLVFHNGIGMTIKKLRKSLQCLNEWRS